MARLDSTHEKPWYFICLIVLTPGEVSREDVVFPGNWPLYARVDKLVLVQADLVVLQYNHKNARVQHAPGWEEGRTGGER